MAAQKGRRDLHKSRNAARSQFSFRCTLNNTIFDVCYNRPGWTETTSESDWDFNFTDVKWVHDFLGNHHMVSRVHFCVVCSDGKLDDKFVC